MATDAEISLDLLVYTRMMGIALRTPSPPLRPLLFSVYSHYETNRGGRVKSIRHTPSRTHVSLFIIGVHYNFAYLIDLDVIQI